MSVRGGGGRTLWLTFCELGIASSMFTVTTIDDILQIASLLLTSIRTEFRPNMVDFQAPGVTQVVSLNGLLVYSIGSHTLSHLATLLGTVETH